MLKQSDTIVSRQELIVSVDIVLSLCALSPCMRSMLHTCCSLLHVLSAWRLAFLKVYLGEEDCAENMTMHLLTVYSLWFDWTVLKFWGL